MSLCRRYNKNSDTPVRLYDSSYCTSLLVPISPDGIHLYSSTDDDHFINRYGGKRLRISGLYLPATEKYAVIDMATINLFHHDGHDLRLLSRPFIIDVDSFQEISLQHLIDEGIVSPSNESRIQDALDKVNTYYDERPEVDEHGGLPSYLRFLRDTYNHIISLTNRNN